MSSFVAGRLLLLRGGGSTARMMRMPSSFPGRIVASSSSSVGVGGGGGRCALPPTSAPRIRRLSGGSASSSAGNGDFDGGGISSFGRAFFPSLCLLTFGLGSWQTMRYFEKVDMVRRREADLDLDPLRSYEDWLHATTRKEEMGGPIDGRSYRRVMLRGEYRHVDEMLVGPRGPPPGALAVTGPNSGRGGGGGMSTSAMGYIVVTPFVIASDEECDECDDDDDDRDAVRRTTTGVRGWLGRLRGGWVGGGTTTTKGDESTSASRKNDEGKERRTMVWINRGWIPRHFVNNNDRRVDVASTTMSSSWERPSGIVRLMAMESDTERPGTFAPPSRIDVGGRGGGGRAVMAAAGGDAEVGPTNATSGINRLLWMDRNAMEEMTSSSRDYHDEDDDRSRRRTHLFVEIDTTPVEDKWDDAASSSPPTFPARASQEYVGEFKVTPAIHAGYAFTWFGLSSAGIVMTRKLLSRGR